MDDPSLTLAGGSDIGRLRPRNEDSLRLLPALGVAVVADGMGGHPGGDVASRVAASAAAELLEEVIPGIDAADDDRTGRLREAMDRSVREAHEAVRAEGEASPELAGMGTTLSVLLVDRAAGHWVVGNVGDSRVYLLRDGTLRQLTRDDTWVQERIEEELLTPEQARDHPYGHILSQCIGLPETPTPRILSGATAPGDAFLVCTDGLTGMLVDEALERELASTVARDAEKCVENLIGLANRAGGRDNVTVAVLVVGAPGATTRRPAS